MNQNGFATPALLTLLPLLLSIAAFAAGSFLILKENRRAHFECRSGLLDAQEKLLSDMERLLALNTQARALRIQRRLAEAAVIASAANPPQLLIAQQALQLVIAQQKALAVIQKSLIAKANLGSRVRVRGVSRKVSSEIRQIKDPTLSVEPTSAEIAPEYKVSSKIEEQHTIKITWNFRPLMFLPEWLNDILKQKNLQFTTECATTSEKGKSKWQPRLKRDKLLSNSALF
jgi:hypothetical protein